MQWQSTALSNCPLYASPLIGFTLIWLLSPALWFSVWAACRQESVLLYIGPLPAYHALLVLKVSVRDLKMRSFSKLWIIVLSIVYNCFSVLLYLLSVSILSVYLPLCISPPFLSYLLSLRLYTVVTDTNPIQCIVEFGCLALEVELCISFSLTFFLCWAAAAALVRWALQVTH